MWIMRRKSSWGRLEGQDAMAAFEVENRNLRYRGSMEASVSFNMLITAIGVCPLESHLSLLSVEVREIAPLRDWKTCFTRL